MILPGVKHAIPLDIIDAQKAVAAGIWYGEYHYDTLLLTILPARVEVWVKGKSIIR